MMEIRKLIVLPMLVGALALGACGGDGEAEVGESPLREDAGLEDGAGTYEDRTQDAAEIFEDGSENDADGLIDEDEENRGTSEGSRPR
jgi:hypothetical protein